MDIENYNEYLVNSYALVEERNILISKKINNFKLECLELENLSQGQYKFQETTYFNKIYLQKYILDSEICKFLKEKITSNYSVDQLKDFLFKYEESSNSDLSNYYLALELYEKALNIEEDIDNKINFEMNSLAKLTSLIEKIENTSKEDYEKLYNQIKKDISSGYLDFNLISEACYKIAIRMLNDIFEYFIKEDYYVS